MTTGVGEETLEGIRALLVEDDPDSRRILAMRLKRIGRFVIREAATGEAALSLAQEWEPNLILLDLKLPGLDGWEVARRIRATETDGRHVPIIAVSAQALPGDEEAAVKAGCDCHLAKPIVDQEYLRSRLEVFFPMLRSESRGEGVSTAS